MSVQTYGIYNQPNVTITMVTRLDEHNQLSVNNDGDKLPDDVINKRLMTFSRHRLASQITGGDKEQSADLPTIFPIN